MYAKNLTENTWLLTKDDGTKVGIVKHTENKFTILGQKEAYASLFDIAGKFGEKLSEEGAKASKKKEELSIEGFPISHNEFYNIEKHNIEESVEPIYTYNNSEKSKVIYAAGYYGIFYDTQYVIKKSPKFVTILENKFVGPFRDEFTTKFAVSQKNKELNLQ